MTMGVFVQVGGGRAPVGYVIQESGCWQWVGAINKKGYGLWRGTLAHRAIYIRALGPLPVGKQLDHLCRNRGCVNQHHLEVVTSRENTLRGVGITAQRSRATHCKNGHPFTEANIYPKPSRNGFPHRECRTCRKEGRQNVR